MAEAKTHKKSLLIVSANFAFEAIVCGKTMYGGCGAFIIQPHLLLENSNESKVVVDGSNCVNIVEWGVDIYCSHCFNLIGELEHQRVLIRSSSIVLKNSRKVTCTPHSTQLTGERPAINEANRVMIMLQTENTDQIPPFGAMPVVRFLPRIVPVPSWTRAEGCVMAIPLNEREVRNAGNPTLTPATEEKRICILHKKVKKVTPYWRPYENNDGQVATTSSASAARELHLGSDGGIILHPINKKVVNSDVSIGEPNGSVAATTAEPKAGHDNGIAPYDIWGADTVAPPSPQYVPLTDREFAARFDDFETPFSDIDNIDIEPRLN